MKTAKRAILTMCLLGSLNAQADSIQIPLMSKHFTDYREYQEINPGLIYSKTVTDHISIVGGGYLNSLSKPSLVAGVEVQHGHFGVQAGVATGYKDLYGYTLQPTGALFGEIGTWTDIKIRLSIIPHKHGAAAISLVKELK